MEAFWLDNATICFCWQLIRSQRFCVHQLKSCVHLLGCVHQLAHEHSLCTTVEMGNFVLSFSPKATQGCLLCHTQLREGVGGGVSSTTTMTRTWLHYICEVSLGLNTKQASPRTCEFMNCSHGNNHSAIFFFYGKSWFHMPLIALLYSCLTLSKGCCFALSREKHKFFWFFYFKIYRSNLYCFVLWCNGKYANSVRSSKQKLRNWCSVSSACIQCKVNGPNMMGFFFPPQNLNGATS